VEPSLEPSPEVPEPSPEPEPHPVHFQCNVLLDGKQIKTFGKTWEINSAWHTGFNDFDKLAREHIKKYMEKRGGVVTFYKGPWRAFWGAIKDPTQHDIDNREDWESLEENLRHRALIGGGIRNAGRVDLKAHFRTHGNADSSPPPPPSSTQIEISATQTRARSKARPQTIRQGALLDSEPELESRLPSRQAHTHRKTPSNSQAESINLASNRSESDEQYLELFRSNWCMQERCPNHQKKACLEGVGAGVGAGGAIHYELDKKLFRIWGDCIATGRWKDSKKAPPPVWAEIYRSKQTPLKFKGTKRTEKKPSEPQPSIVATPSQQAAAQVQIFNPTYHQFGQPFQGLPPYPGYGYGYGSPSPFPSVQYPYHQTPPPPPPPPQIEVTTESPAPPSSPIKAGESDQVLEEFSLWLKDHIPPTRYSIVQSGLLRIIEQGYTLEDIRDLPAKDFMDIGVKAAVLSLVKPHLRIFAREYKQRQERQAATSLTKPRGAAGREWLEPAKGATQLLDSQTRDGTPVPYSITSNEYDVPGLYDIISTDDNNTQSYDFGEQEEQQYS
jgi:hypothetical protein